ncbi:MAG TPA: SRPBCC domain-containing protein [Acidobacteriaceae bacterium]|nr:SRPBCC domain-containing protein [Acidobacteriaceae bacterium]
MTLPRATTAAEGRDLILTCILSAPPAKIFRAWTDPALITQWFTLADWRATSAVLDVRAGGSSSITMRKPDGTEMINNDVYLEVVQDARLVFTDAYTSAWEPAERPFLTWIVTFEAFEAKTKYTVIARHWTVGDREVHENMGFHQSWPITTEQLAALVEQA